MQLIAAAYFLKDQDSFGGAADQPSLHLVLLMCQYVSGRGTTLIIAISVMGGVDSLKDGIIAASVRLYVCA